jgi:hypothetical protein
VVEYKELITAYASPSSWAFNDSTFGATLGLSSTRSKESCCLNPKMAAYYQEVRKLEDKHDGLKLNHIL